MRHECKVATRVTNHAMRTRSRIDPAAGMHHPLPRDVTDVPAVADLRMDRVRRERKHMGADSAPPFGRQGLGPSFATIEDAVEHVCGLNAQTPRAPYVALHARVTAFDPAELDRAVHDYKLVKANLMRGTVHLVSRSQYARWRQAMQPALVRSVRGFFPDLLTSVDQTELIEAGRSLLRDHPDGLTRAEIGDRLSPCFPGTDPAALAFGVRLLVPVVQRASDMWNPAQPRHILAESVIEDPLVDAAEGLNDLLISVLAGYGPMRSADVSYFSGLTRLATPVARASATTEGTGAAAQRDARRASFDVPDVFVLPEYDNALFARMDGKSKEVRSILQRPGPAMTGSVWRSQRLAASWRFTKRDGFVLVPFDAWDRTASIAFDDFREWYQAIDVKRP